MGVTMINGVEAKALFVSVKCSADTVSKAQVIQGNQSNTTKYSNNL